MSLDVLPDETPLDMLKIRVEHFALPSDDDRHVDADCDVVWLDGAVLTEICQPASVSLKARGGRTVEVTDAASQALSPACHAHVDRFTSPADQVNSGFVGKGGAFGPWHRGRQVYVHPDPRAPSRPFPGDRGVGKPRRDGPHGL